jgi:hypothetical protein
MSDHDGVSGTGVDLDRARLETGSEAPAAGESVEVEPEPEDLRAFEPTPSPDSVVESTRCPACGGDRIEPLPPTGLYLAAMAFVTVLMVGYQFSVVGGLVCGAIAYLFVTIFGPRFPKYRCDACGEHWR